jgi:hypothetical protein
MALDGPHIQGNPEKNGGIYREGRFGDGFEMLQEK